LLFAGPRHETTIAANLDQQVPFASKHGQRLSKRSVSQKSDFHQPPPTLCAWRNHAYAHRTFAAYCPYHIVLLPLCLLAQLPRSSSSALCSLPSHPSNLPTLGTSFPHSEFPIISAFPIQFAQFSSVPHRDTSEKRTFQTNPFESMAEYDQSSRNAKNQHWRLVRQLAPESDGIRPKKSTTQNSGR
jgi:hypothetical protein